ncbi:MAG: iron ABC transporter permease [Trichlorobacter sp.]|uniref:FecCD family ABC transporter permease n=1 Tax=Trichlorobacter sp. TaxID=2911007 RepID=UPI00256154F1|nr:iron ABC transporter permease [Trichlorobacter sp.]MDK9719251.1 iron ABC transporter permease [Trichlorobacter sp.]
MKRHPLFIMLGCLVAVLLLSLSLGQQVINPFNLDPLQFKIVLELRLPRIVVALLMGGSLGVAGAILQGVFRNPLADPYVLGTSSGAALAAAFGLLATQGTAVWLVPGLALVGALVTSAVVVSLGRDAWGVRAERLLLAGVGIGFFLSAILMLVMSLAQADGVKRALLWMAGDLAGADWSVVPVASLLMLFGFVLALARRRGLNALALGDEVAFGLGLEPGRERTLLVLAASLLTAASVALGGIVGFVGLMVPHAVRALVGADARRVLPLSAIGGGMLLCLADTVGRSVLPPVEIPAGVVTALIGAPWFLIMLRRATGGGMR